MRVLIVSQYFDPEPVPIPGEIARALSGRGHSVRVLTAYPNYPSGRVLPGYRQSWRGRERRDGIPVCRVPIVPDHSQSLLRRMLNYASFALSAATVRRFARGADVVYVYATQMSAAFAPWFWRLSGGAPYVLHVQDLWPDSIVGSTMASKGILPRVVTSLLTPWLTSVYRKASAVVGIAPTMASTLVERGAVAERTHYVPNWSAAPQQAPTFVSSLDAETAGATRVVYAGNVGEMQDLDTAVEAAHCAAGAGIILRIVGEGTERARLGALVASRGYANVEFVDPVPRDRVHEVYADADFALVSLKNLPVFRGTIPSKLQSALAHGVPVITTVPGDAGEIVARERVGYCASPEDAAGLVEAFRMAGATDREERAAMSKRARELHTAEFSADTAMDRLERILEGAAR